MSHPLSTRVLKKLANNEKQAYPIASEILSSHLYDDLLTGANSIDKARTSRNKMFALLSRGGFNIRQWALNNENIINDLETNALHAKFVFNEDRSSKALGVIRCARNDEIYIIRCNH